MTTIKINREGSPEFPLRAAHIREGAYYECEDGRVYLGIYQDGGWVAATCDEKSPHSIRSGSSKRFREIKTMNLEYTV